MARILVVDDESNIRMMVGLALRAAGHEVATAADGAEGLDKFGDGAGWELVLLDQRMPGLEGLDVLRAMRRRDPAAKVVMITAFGTIDLATDAMRAGATDFLRKPFTLDVLRGAVQAALSGATARSPAAASSGAAPGPLTFGFTAINGYRIATPEADAAPPAVEDGGAKRYAFEVRGLDQAVRRCTVQLPSYVIELIKAHTDREVMPDDDHFWRWLGEEALANYLWQHAELPPGGLLQVDELSTGLRRWINAMLTQ